MATFRVDQTAFSPVLSHPPHTAAPHRIRAGLPAQRTCGRVGRCLRLAAWLSRSSRVAARAENRRADAHQGAARSHGGFQVGAHAHGQGVKPQACGIQSIKKASGPFKQSTFSCKIRSRVGNAHQTAQAQPGQLGHRLRQRQRIRRHHARLGGAAVDVDLDAHLQRRQMRRALLTQALRDLEAVHRVHPVKMLGHQPGFVALDRANAVPHQRQLAQRGDFLHRFLDVVFAKPGLPGGIRGLDGIRTKGFGNRQKCDGVITSASGLAGGVQARAHRSQLRRNRGHNCFSVTNNPGGFVDITQLLAFSVKNKASDLHLSAGLPPMIRVHGDVRRLNVDALDHKQVHAMVYDIMNDAQRKHYEAFLEIDFSFEIEGLARFRVNAFNQNRGCGAVFRTIPSKILTLEQLNCPKIFADLALKPRGLVLVTGPTGSGKSTTLAAMVNYLNENEFGHILTVEDPIEFVHESKKCLINQREVGPHTQSFAAALRSALREDPDAILVGEMRDLETIRLAMTAAETGHLVFGTLHTSSAAKTIDRIIDVFPAEEKEMVRAMLSESLQAVISQTLCKTKDGQGRIAAHEIMLGTSAIRNLIREGKVAQMYSSIQTGNSVGMQTLDQNLTDLVRRNIISAAEARTKAKIPENFPG